jgi:hypothetical protein
MNALHKGNDWAGAAHWKFGLRNRAPKSAEAIPAEIPFKAKKTKKDRVVLEFSSEPVPEIAFGETKASRSDSTLLTAASLKKSAELGRIKALNLPPDAHLEPKDLCRLFLRPRMLVMPAMLSYMLKPKKTATTAPLSTDPHFPHDEDFIWGEVQRLPKRASHRFSIGDDYGHEDRQQDYVYENEDDNHSGVDEEAFTANENAAVVVEEEDRHGLHIRLSGMAKAVRKVEKIDIG